MGDDTFGEVVVIHPGVAPAAPAISNWRRFGKAMRVVVPIHLVPVAAGVVALVRPPQESVGGDGAGALIALVLLFFCLLQLASLGIAALVSAVACGRGARNPTRVGWLSSIGGLLIGA